MKGEIMFNKRYKMYLMVRCSLSILLTSACTPVENEKTSHLMGQNAYKYFAEFNSPDRSMKEANVSIKRGSQMIMEDNLAMTNGGKYSYMVSGKPGQVIETSISGEGSGMCRLYNSERKIVDQQQSLSPAGMKNSQTITKCSITVP